MAVVAGESGAWTAVRSELRAKHLDVSDPVELMPLLHTLQQRQAQGIGPLLAGLAEELAQNEETLARMRAELPNEIARQTQPLLLEARQIERTLDTHRSASWLKRYTVLLLPTLKLNRRKQVVYEKKQSITNTLHQGLRSRQQELDYIEKNPTLVAESRLRQTVEQATVVDKVLHSPQLAGARAELDVLTCLKRLPNTYHVYGDLNLRAHRKIRFAGEYLQTAQIDYFVVGPSGVFIVEVKCWGQRHIAQGQYHDPYEQVGRHSYLCYDMIRTYGKKARVHSLIVNCGVLPPPRGEDYHVQVVTLSNLLNCLTRRRSQPLDEAERNQILKILEGFRQ